ncbi:MAG: DJ-1/PfpI family protein [Epsilonproteobacteria bacterium]|nr:DJ-1/PfpI family protein [Campylobacterota bacterium]
MAALNDTMLVKGANGITVQAECEVKDVAADTLDMIVLPGGWDGTHALADDENVQNLLREMDAKGKEIGAICAAPFALNRAGVLKENYTCYPSVEKEIREEGYQGDSAMVVQDQNVMTSRGPATALCFGLAIVKKLKGEEQYRALKEGLLASYCE